jgi:cytochrome c oxidase assembly protein subunit 15
MPTFKRIYFVEYAHRLWGNAIGMMFGLPMIYFWARGYFKRKMKLRMLGLLALGGTQGLIGWWMVKSGLMPKPGYQTEPRVQLTLPRFLSTDFSFT